MSRARSPRAGSTFATVLVFLCAGALIVAGIVAGAIASYARVLPDISRMADYQPSRTTQIFARDGTLLANVYRVNRIWVSIDHIPPLVREAFIATEDRNFYRHHGVDLGGVLRAALADLRHDRFQGASTITQQLARRLFLNDRVSFARKIEEMVLALEIERHYTKDEILERYLNLIYFGAGAYGIQAASHVYFGKDVDHLNLAQAAVLAGLPAAPSAYSPYVSVQRARDRQRHVLRRMVDSGFVSQAEASLAELQPLQLVGYRPAGLQSYRDPYFTTFALHQLDEQFGADAVAEGGLSVDTSLDPRLQRLAGSAVDWGIGQAGAEGIGANQAALVAIRPSTGEIVAMVGGAGGFSLTNQFNRAWQTLRQPGSSFKAIVYTAAIDNGWTPTSIIADTPITYPAGDGTFWSPQDDDHRFLGPITLRYALAESRNVAAVRLASAVGIDRVIDYAHRMGITAPLEPNLSLALGTNGVSPLDMAAAYQTLADQGIHVDPTAIRLVRDAFGTSLLDNRYPTEYDVVPPSTAAAVTSMLESVITSGTGYPNAQIGRPAAGKTGTTSDFRDAWFVGYTPDLVTAVWIGNDNDHPMRESYGGNVPARIWARFMKAALQGTPKHPFPVAGDAGGSPSPCPPGVTAPTGCRTHARKGTLPAVPSASVAAPTPQATVPVTVATEPPAPDPSLPPPETDLPPLPLASP